MVEVISGTDISGEVIKLIESTQKNVVLVTPYLDPWDRLTQAIKRILVRPGMRVTLVLRGGKDLAKQSANAAELKAAGVAVLHLQGLHAKVYINEAQALVTSLNLLESSALNSWEMAIRADRERDPEVYDAIKTKTIELATRAMEDMQATARAVAAPARPAAIAAPARPVAAPARPVAAPARPVAAPTRPTKAPRVQLGSCIRCSETIVRDTDKPYCADCYKSWAKYENADYKESYCHGCAKEKSTSMAKPLCKPCWDATQ